MSARPLAGAPVGATPAAVLPLVRLRLAGFVRTGRALAPLLAALVSLGVLYGGGQAQAAEAYGVSAVVLFGVLAWQTKMLFDAEPDGQRRLAVVAVGSVGRDVAAGLLAATVAAFAAVLLALVLPWLVRGVTTPNRPEHAPLAEQLALGVWAHAVAVSGAVVLGALASRAITRGAAHGVVVLVAGVVLALVLGQDGSAVPWLAPPVMA
ncbi:MAG TPA: hypothetical protein VES42_26625, partial [Pilimelia sp.]|nr:hypothetical protein [Pilimelia sp.]